GSWPTSTRICCPRRHHGDAAVGCSGDLLDGIQCSQSVLFASICQTPHTNARCPMSIKKEDLKHRRQASLDTPTDLASGATRDIAGAMNAILADVYALYLKTKNFH